MHAMAFKGALPAASLYVHQPLASATGGHLQLISLADFQQQQQQHQQRAFSANGAPVSMPIEQRSSSSTGPAHQSPSAVQLVPLVQLLPSGPGLGFGAPLGSESRQRHSSALLGGYALAQWPPQAPGYETLLQQQLAQQLLPVQQNSLQLQAGLAPPDLELLTREDQGSSGAESLSHGHYHLTHLATGERPSSRRLQRLQAGAVFGTTDEAAFADPSHLDLHQQHQQQQQQHQQHGLANVFAEHHQQQQNQQVAGSYEDQLQANYLASARPRRVDLQRSILGQYLDESESDAGEFYENAEPGAAGRRPTLARPVRGGGGGGKFLAPSPPSAYRSGSIDETHPFQPPPPPLGQSIILGQLPGSLANEQQPKTGQSGQARQQAAGAKLYSRNKSARLEGAKQLPMIAASSAAAAASSRQRAAGLAGGENQLVTLKLMGQQQQQEPAGEVATAGAPGAHQQLSLEAQGAGLQGSSAREQRSSQYWRQFQDQFDMV